MPEYADHITLNGNQLKSSRVELLSSAPTDTVGRSYYNTATDRQVVHNNAGTATPLLVAADIPALIAASKFTVSSVDRTSNPPYQYYGGTYGSGAWKINRWNTLTGARTAATVVNNSGITTLASALAGQTSLTYA